ncbi:MAG: replicative DNA helicase [Flavobacteriales bacterium]|nr:replicative DNA helicase [Flavobacteriales bacterium]
MQNKNSKIPALQNKKIPPQAIDFEEGVLGALMIDKNATGIAIEILSAECFYKEKHQEIFQVLLELFNDAEPIDLLTVTDKLRKNGKLKMCGGEVYLAELTQKVVSSAHIEHHARIIVQKYIQRKLISISSTLINDAFDETTDIIELMDKAEREIFKVTEGSIKKNYSKATDLIHQAIKEIESIGNEDGISGIPSGFLEIDKITSGWQRSDLIIIAARPGMGKTAFVLSMARNIAVDHKKPVAVFSLEMNSLQLITRLISSETGLASDKLRSGKMEPYEWEQLHSKIKKIENAELFIDDTPGLSIFDLRAKCRRLVSQHGVKIIIIDYLQLMQGSSKGGVREQEISSISRSLKSIAKELNIPIICLSQLNRGVELRTDKRPILSDLRESGAIEQDADIVNFIYRPEYYNIDMWDTEPQTSCLGQAEFIIAKHRNGSLGRRRLKFNASLAKFGNLEKDIYQNQYNSKMNMDENEDQF